MSSYGELALRGAKLRPLIVRDPQLAATFGSMIAGGASDDELGVVLAMGVIHNVESKSLWRYALRQASGYASQENQRGVTRPLVENGGGAWSFVLEGLLSVGRQRGWLTTKLLVEATVSSWTPESVQRLESAINDSRGEQKKGCYIATAVYGSYDAPEVWVLRRFRGSSLAPTPAGRLFIRAYYAVSPVLVRWGGESLRWLARPALGRFVKHLRAAGGGRPGRAV